MLYLRVDYCVQTFLLHFSIYLLNFQVLCILAASAFTPEARYAHTSVLISDRLYFLGGTVDSKPSNEFFYLDLSSSFNTQSLPWVDLTGTRSIPVWSSWAAATIGNDRVSIYLIGGEMRDQAQNLLPNNNNIVFAYNTNAQLWYAPNISGPTPTRRTQVQAVTDHSGKIYYFGGRFDVVINGLSNSIDNNNFTILDTKNLSWSLATVIGAPSPRESFSVTILGNGVILFIGGRELNPQNGSFDDVNITQIPIYDTDSGQWYTMTSTPNIRSNDFETLAYFRGGPSLHTFSDGTERNGGDPSRQTYGNDQYVDYFNIGPTIVKRSPRALFKYKARGEWGNDGEQW
ncbi:10722_t:CDS:2, partial [Acaulospora colombiana]